MDPADNPLMDRRYRCDDTGNIARIDTREGAHEYGYDDLDRLTAVTHPQLEDEAFTYDPAGNRTTSATTDGTWQYDDADRLLDYDDTSFTYDGNGATTLKVGPEGTTAYDYGIRRRLERIDTSDSVVQTNAYDPMERRVRKTVDGEVTYYLYGRQGLLVEFDKAGNATRHYGWRPRGIWSTDPLWVIRDGKVSYYLTDHLGTPQRMIGRNGIERWSARYRVFGEAQVAIDDVKNPWRFPGQYFDQSIEQYQNWWRSYNPKSGVYFRADPVKKIRPIVNAYVYAAGNPIALSDPTGRLPWTFYACASYVAYDVASTLATMRELSEEVEEIREKQESIRECMADGTIEERIVARRQLDRLEDRAADKVSEKTWTFIKGSLRWLVVGAACAVTLGAPI